MTNYEWLLKEYPSLIFEAVTQNIYIAVSKKDGLPNSCSNVFCKDCLFYSEDLTCTEKRKKWLKKEYVEKPKKIKVKIKDLSDATKEIICQSHTCGKCPLFFGLPINCIKHIDYEDSVHLSEKMDEEIEVENND